MHSFMVNILFHIIRLPIPFYYFISCIDTLSAFILGPNDETIFHKVCDNYLRHTIVNNCNLEVIVILVVKIIVYDTAMVLLQ